MVGRVQYPSLADSVPSLLSLVLQTTHTHTHTHAHTHTGLALSVAFSQATSPPLPCDTPLTHWPGIQPEEFWVPLQGDGGISGSQSQFRNWEWLRNVKFWNFVSPPDFVELLSAFWCSYSQLAVGQSVRHLFPEFHMLGKAKALR